MRLTADIILRAEASINPCKERELNLRGFKIPVIENIGATQDMFDTLDFSDNEIKRLENFPRMERLTTLLLNNNHISKINPKLKDQLPNLTTLILTNNRLHHLAELDALEGLTRLTMISLLENPVVRRQHYRLYVIQRCPSLKFLDFRRVKQKERAEAARLFKSRAGKRMQDDVQKELLTFQADEKRKREKRRLTETQKQLIREAIKNAKTPEEVDKLERQLRAGIMPNLAKGISTPMPTPVIARPAPPPPDPPTNAIITKETTPITSSDNVADSSDKEQDKEEANAEETLPMETDEQNTAMQTDKQNESMEKDEQNIAMQNGELEENTRETETQLPTAMETNEESTQEGEKTENNITPSSDSEKMDGDNKVEPNDSKPNPDIQQSPESPENNQLPVLSESEIKSMKVVDLKSELVKRDLPVNGLKAALIDRLMEACGHAETANST